MSLYQDLKKFSQKDRISFHIPGHKGGVGLNPDWMQDAFLLDVTEFSETDDLQNPQGILRTAQDRAAKVFGAGESFYLTGGTTLGLLAAILAGCKTDDKILLDRTCHRAVAAGLVLSGATAVFVEPNFDKEQGLYTKISATAVAEMLEKEPEIVGMVLTCPTYYGLCSPVEEIAEVLHQKGKFLVVDEAHGAHFAFSDRLPKTALSQGADVAVQSAHKTLSALGQSSLLHLGKESLISSEAVASALRILMTTSPSYLLMSAMDESILQMAEKGREELEQRIAEITDFKESLSQTGRYAFPDAEMYDATRLVIDVRKTGHSGYQVAEMLKETFGIYSEMADEYHLVLVVTAANTAKDLEELKKALLSLESGDGKIGEMVPLPMPKMVLCPRDAYREKKEYLSIDKAKGRIAADVVSVCPPGAAMILPGQQIEEETIAYCQRAGLDTKIAVIAEPAERVKG